MNKANIRWSLFFILASVLVATLAASWNIFLVEEYEKMQELAESFSAYRAQLQLESPPWAKVVLGSLGFSTILGLLLIFFIKTLKEIQRNQIYRAFLDKVSHELKSPLTTLELTTSLLQKKHASEDSDTQELWRAHNSELRRLRTEVELMLESSRWQRHKAKIQKTPFNLEAFLTQFWPAWQATLGPESNLLREGDRLNFTVSLDEAMLRMICQNIVDNARKYTVGLPQLRVITRRKDHRWSLCFQDQGLGFDASVQKKIFEQFYRAKTEAPYAISGSGLGLYLAREASKAMGLKITASSPGPGKGAAFEIEGRVHG
jgi:signal transduction histidine kinase